MQSKFWKSSPDKLAVSLERTVKITVRRINGNGALLIFKQVTGKFDL